jgi:hypothetical protein
MLADGGAMPLPAGPLSVTFCAVEFGHDPEGEPVVDPLFFSSSRLKARSLNWA